MRNAASSVGNFIASCGKSSLRRVEIRRLLTFHADFLSILTFDLTSSGFFFSLGCICFTIIDWTFKAQTELEAARFKEDEDVLKATVF